MNRSRPVTASSLLDPSASPSLSNAASSRRRISGALYCRRAPSNAYSARSQRAVTPHFDAETMPQRLLDRPRATPLRPLHRRHKQNAHAVSGSALRLGFRALQRQRHREYRAPRPRGSAPRFRRRAPARCRTKPPAPARRPLPSAFVVKNGSKIRGTISGGIPSPLSLTAQHAPIARPLPPASPLSPCRTRALASPRPRSAPD